MDDAWVAAMTLLGLGADTIAAGLAVPLHGLPTDATVTADTLNVRGAPNVRARLAYQVHRGDAVQVWASDADWRLMTWQGQAGWAHGGYVA